MCIARFDSYQQLKVTDSESMPYVRQREKKRFYSYFISWHRGERILPLNLLRVVEGN